LIPIPRLYLTASTNQSPSCNWKRQRLVRLEDSRLNCCRNTIYDGAGGWWKEKGSYLGAPRRVGVTLIFHPWAREDMLTICKEHGVEAEQRFSLRQGSPDKS